MKVAAIVPSAGIGKRMYLPGPYAQGAGRPLARAKGEDKPLIKLCGKEILFYALKALQDSPVISEIIIAARGSNISRINRLVRKNNFLKVKEIVRGGRRRFQSVFNALSRVSPDADFVLVHDAARPFLTQDLIMRTVNAAKRCGASLACVKVSPTIKEARPNGRLVKKTLDRGLLWEAQTPQVFRKDILIDAYRNIDKNSTCFTDDASLVEKKGKGVSIVWGSYDNIKITTPGDLIIAEALLKSYKL